MSRCCREPVHTCRTANPLQSWTSLCAPAISCYFTNIWRPSLVGWGSQRCPPSPTVASRARDLRVRWAVPQSGSTWRNAEVDVKPRWTRRETTWHTGWIGKILFLSFPHHPFILHLVSVLSSHVGSINVSACVGSKQVIRLKHTVTTIYRIVTDNSQGLAHPMRHI